MERDGNSVTDNTKLSEVPPKARKANGEAEPEDHDDVHRGYDLDAFRLDQSPAELDGVEEAAGDVVVGKPDQTIFFRTHPDPAFHFETFLFRDKRTREFYLVHPSMWKHPVLLMHRTPHVLVPFIDQYNSLGLWPIRLIDDRTGRDNPFWMDARRAARIAEKRWVRLELHPKGQGYRILVAEDLESLGEPVWPTFDLQMLVDQGFEGRCIDSERHPIVLALRGAKRGPQ